MLPWIDLAPIVVYLAVLLAITLFGLRQKETSQENLILAGRKLTLPAFVATLVSTWYGGILGVGEFTFRYGVSNWLVFGVPYYIAAALFAIFIAGRARRSPDMTIPDRLHANYGPAASAAGAGILVIVSLPVANLLMMGILAQQIFGAPLWAGIVFGAFFSVMHIMTGGFRAVLEADFIQFTLMYIGFILLFAFATVKLGGFAFIASHVPPDHLSATGGNPLGYIALWYIIALGTLVEPAFYQRCFAAKTPAIARRGIVVSILFWIVFDFMTTSCGLYARAHLSSLTDPMAAYPELARAVLPTGLLGIFLLSLVAIVMSTVDSYIFLTATTISHDFLWRFAKVDERRMKFYTGIGLAASSVIMIILALAFDSVVTIWHDFGSVGTAALLFPLVTSYWGKYRFSNRGAFISIIAAAAVTTLALLYPRWSGNDGYFGNVEPIFIGLAVSAIVFVLTKTEKESAKRPIS